MRISVPAACRTCVFKQAYYSFDAKLKFLQALNEIKTLNYALQFCSLLIEARKMHEEYRDEGGKLCSSSDVDHPEHSKQIFYDIQNIVSQEPVGIAKIIFMVLNAPEENLRATEQQLLNFLLKSECGKSCEYLVQLIGTVESLVKSFLSKNLYFYYFGRVEDHERNLVKLNGCMFAYGKQKALTLFGAMFKIGISALDFSSEEKEEIKDLVIKAMPNIEPMIQDLCYNSQLRLGILHLQLRSSLQFVGDLFADYSADNEILRKFILGLDPIGKRLDKFFARCESIHSDDDFPDGDDFEIFDDFYYLSLEDLNFAGACDVPKDHVWWQKFKEAYFK